MRRASNLLSHLYNRLQRMLRIPLRHRDAAKLRLYAGYRDRNHKSQYRKHWIYRSNRHRDHDANVVCHINP